MEYESYEGEDDMVNLGVTLTAGCCVQGWFKQFVSYCFQEAWIFFSTKFWQVARID